MKTKTKRKPETVAINLALIYIACVIIIAVILTN
jgi:hypothetical protein